jgi:serine/threonine protein kinase
MAKSTGMIFAFKEINYDQSGITQVAVREVLMLRGLNHPNIIKLHDVIYANPKVTLVLEYIPHDLSKVIGDLPPGEVIHPAIVKSFMRQILSAVDYCHRRQIFHRDISPRNIMFDKNQVLKIIDFGLASIFDLPA